jgi:hypothetical protein
VITGSRRAGKAVQALGHEVFVRLLQRRPGRTDSGAEIDGYDEGDNACAAEISWSKSGTSASS